MYLWIDNTTLHGVIRTVDGRAAGESDVGTFLQFATEVVFAERIYFSAFESDAVQQQSSDLRSRLIAYGLDPDVMVGLSDLAKYKDACHAAGDALAKDLRFAVQKLPEPTAELLISTEPDARAIVSGGDALVVDLLKTGAQDVDRPDLGGLEERRASGATAYMLGVSDDLWKAVQQVKSWGGSEALVPVLMRLYLNEQLARRMPTAGDEIKIDYAPAASRARLIDRENTLALEALDRLVGTAVNQIRPQPMPAPSVASALLHASRADRPASILQEAISARAKAAELRALLAQAVARRITTSDFGPMLQTINALAINLAYDLGVEKAPSYARAFEVQFFDWLPVPLPNLASALDVIEYKRAQKQVLVLSEFVKTMAWQRLDEYAYDRLMEAATHERASAG